MSMTALSAETRFEHDLIDAARDGDDRAFEELYARYSGRIAGFVRARVRDHGRSEDVAQEVFISALRRLRSSSQPIQFKPWIYEIAKNACIDEYRRTQRIREVSLDSGDDESGSSVLPSRAPTPLAAVETKQRLRDLRDAFGGLSDSHHQLLVLREFEGLSYDEIGARTGMTRQMVESGLFRARRKLTEEYEELASGRRCSQIKSTIEDGRALSARSLGIRERRVFARHLAHCQPCRVVAHLAGVDETLLTRRRIGAKIAGLLPLPLWRWPWAAGRSRHLVGGAQTLSHVAEPAAASAFGGAAVAAAVIALAVGTGSAPVATHADRRVGPPVTTRSLARAHVAVPPAGGHVVPAAPSLAAAHARLQLGGKTRRLNRAAVPAPVRHSRSVG
ncbi:MAG: sigma-70 family RNA polymerase sigma factor, partial [Actinomycetota bacterium]|nr:sigma-70 family RNA polymerase sigma factor [Actinomycetota bacterium]